MTAPGLRWSDVPAPVRATLARGTVIPAHPLALDAGRGFDRASQRALSRYYLDAGAGGLAVGVHTTQFAIREAGLHRPVLALAAETARAWTDRPVVLVAGAVGRTAQATAEARLARELGYHAVLLSLAAMKGAGEDELVEHCRAVAAEMPVIGFYLQRAVGGIRLSRGFWARFFALDNVVAAKIAPFDRYATLDACVGLAAARAESRVTLYTGNDDHIVADLLTPFAVRAGGREVEIRFRGGLLGHWSAWTKRAVELLARCHAAQGAGVVPAELLRLDAGVTDCNAALFDVAHDFAGCIAGCHAVLRDQGLMATIHCLDPDETLSPGQAEEIARVRAAWPELTDDEFVRANLARWRG